jgi:hypothetical protein
MADVTRHDRLTGPEFKPRRPPEWQLPAAAWPTRATLACQTWPAVLGARLLVRASCGCSSVDVVVCMIYD